MNHQLRLLLQTDHDTWMCEVGGWDGADLNTKHIARMRGLLDDGVAVINARARRKEPETRQQLSPSASKLNGVHSELKRPELHSEIGSLCLCPS